MSSARPQSPMIMEELVIKYIKNTEISFRELMKKGSIPAYADFHSKAWTPERTEGNLFRHRLRAQCELWIS